MMKPVKMAIVSAAMFGSAAVALAGSNPDVTGTRTPVGTKLGSATLWAAINADGTIARSDGANATTTAAISGFTGSYQVGFYRNVTGCSYVATIGNAGSGNPAHGTIVVAARAGLVTGVFVETRDLTGALANYPFHLLVTC